LKRACCDAEGVTVLTVRLDRGGISSGSARPSDASQAAWSSPGLWFQVGQLCLPMGAAARHRLLRRRLAAALGLGQQ